MKRDKWLERLSYWLVVSIGLAVLIWLLAWLVWPLLPVWQVWPGIALASVTWLVGAATWLVGAAHNSSDWFRGKLVDEGLWVLAVFFVWLAASLVAARVLALFVWPKKTSELNDKGFTAAGFVLILLGAGAWTLIGTVDPVPRFYVLVLLAVGAVGVGIVMLGLGLGQRLRLQINVTGSDGKTDPVKSAYVAARMEALGTSRPQGLQFPHGTDVANLPETALSTAATNDSKIAAAVFSIFRSVAFIVPWKAEIVLVDRETAAVTLSRNGQRFDSQLISTSSLLPDSPNNEAADVDRAVLTTAAAFMLFSLSRIYPDLNKGMSGARNWRGVAAQVLATTVPWKNDPQTSTELLARAVNEDPRNLAAWLGYLVQRAGSYGTPETLPWVLENLKTLKKALDKLDPDTKTEIALRLRLLRTLTFFSTNLRIQLLQGLLDEDVQDHECLNAGIHERAKAATQDALDSASCLIDVVASAISKPQPPMLEEYVATIQPLAACLYLHVLNLPEVASTGPSPEDRNRRESWAKQWILDLKDPNEVPKEIAKEEMFYLSSLQFHYDRAGALLEEDTENFAKPLAHLELALSLKYLRANAESDPSLKPVRGTAQFAALIDKKVRISSLTALKGLSEKLAAEGIRFTSDFAARKDGNKQLSESLKVTQDTVKWIRGICELAEGCSHQELAVEWTNFLTYEGINDAAALRVFVAGLDVDDPSSSASLERIKRRAGMASVDAPEKNDFRSWADKMPLPVATVPTWKSVLSEFFKLDGANGS